MQQYLIYLCWTDIFQWIKKIDQIREYYHAFNFFMSKKKKPVFRFRFAAISTAKSLDSWLLVTNLMVFQKVLSISYFLISLLTSQQEKLVKSIQYYLQRLVIHQMLDKTTSSTGKRGMKSTTVKKCVASNKKWQ